MLRKVGSHLREQWMGAVALFLVLCGGTAYAANTILSTDITNNEVYSADVRDDTLAGGGLGDADLRTGSVRSAEVATNALSGADIDQATLGKVPNADSLDGLDSDALVQGNGRVISNRVLSVTQGTSLLEIPGVGEFTVDACNGVTGRIGFDNKGTGNVFVTVLDGGTITHQGAMASFVSASKSAAFLQIQLARDTGNNTKLVHATVTWDGANCVFAAQAIQTPSL